MRRPIALFALASMVLITSAVAPARGAVVLFRLWIDALPSTPLPGSAPNNWFLTADCSNNGDNFGIASYSVALTGNIAVQNLSPKATYTDSSLTNPNLTTGFTFARSPDNILPVTASQDITSGNALIVQGFGIFGGNLLSPVPAGWDGVTNTTQPVYNGQLLIAVGSYSGPFPNYDVSGTTATVLATLTPPIQTFTPTVGKDRLLPSIPEPTSLSLLGLGAALMLISQTARRAVHLDNTKGNLHGRTTL